MKKTFIIAEAGVNHNGSTENAFKLVKIAKNSGADAVKFQSFITENIITKDAPKANYHIQTTGSDTKQSWFSLLKTQELGKESHYRIKKYCEELGIEFLSTPYDKESVDLLDDLGVKTFKLASTDFTNFLLIKHIISKQKPIIFSTAMASFQDIIKLKNFLEKQKFDKYSILHCTGSYPTIDSELNLKSIKYLKEKLRVRVGFSDHSLDYCIVPAAAVALGAEIYEKHFTISRNMNGPDHRMSLEPNELKILVDTIRNTETTLGKYEKTLQKEELINRDKLRKSLVAAKKIKKGKFLTEEDITAKRPGTGICPSDFKNYLGKKILVDLDENTPLEEAMFIER